MSRISDWMRAMGSAGAVANAAVACQQRRDEEALLSARLSLIAPAPAAATTTEAA